MTKDLIRTGHISSINYKKGMAKVHYEDTDDLDIVTEELPLLASAYDPPAIGDPVLVVHFAKGQGDGVIIGRYWCDELVPDSGAKGSYKKQIGSGSVAAKNGAITISADTLTFKTSAGTISVADIISYINSHS
jgi:hypothetical protein